MASNASPMSGSGWPLMHAEQSFIGPMIWLQCTVFDSQPQGCDLFSRSGFS